VSRPLSIAVATGTRADYGIFRPLLRRLEAEEAFDLSLLVTGTHLSSRFGLTVSEIEADGYRIATRIPLDLDDDTEVGVAKATAAALVGFSEALAADRPGLLLLLGDRFETLAAATAAQLARVPVAHLHGGELTCGAVDDAIRHSVTKMSWLHFTATESYRRRVIQLGEDPARVHATGALGVDNALGMPLMTRQELEADLGPVFGPATAVVTYHPVTLETGTAAAQMNALSEALTRFSDLSVVLTAPNADEGNRAVFEAIAQFVETHRGRASSFVSLGARRYLSLVAEADVCVGNSSSGIIEAPSLGTPTVDIGDRQTGRDRGPSVIHCEPTVADITDAIRLALSPELRAVAARRDNPYGDGRAAERIVRILKGFASASGPTSLKKTFFDLPVQESE
jgi:UDP-hydrolysing UDP-N-acetyl-D-glucosamine 2-epimerase